MENKARIMWDMTVKEIRAGLQETQTVILPVGCVEQHGYHLPTSVDSHNAMEIAARASAQTGCFVAAPQHYCFSGGMLPGTVNLSPQVFSLVLMDICQSLAAQGFKNIVILLGHGGTENTRAALDAAENFQRLRPGQFTDVTVSVAPFWELSKEIMAAFAEGDYHAAGYETSLMLYWRPEMVRMEEAQLDNADLVAQMRTDPDAYLLKTKGVEHPYVVPRLTQRPEMQVGVMGDYATASAERGRAIAEECVQALVEFINQLQRSE